MRMADFMAMLRAASREFGADTPIAEIRTVPSDTPLPADPYLTRTTVVGQSHTALLVRLTPEGGMRLEVVGAGETDAHRRSQRAMYGRRKRKWREEGADEARSTADLEGNPNEALETETGIG